MRAAICLAAALPLASCSGTEPVAERQEESHVVHWGYDADDLTATLSTLFGGIEGVAIVGSVLAAGRFAGSQRFRDATYDVLAGATLGYIVGRTTIRVNGAPLEPKRPMVTVSPILEQNTRGVQVAVSF